MRIEYKSNIPGGIPNSETESRFITALNESYSKELAIGSTLIGPHRDDFKLWVKGVDMKIYASRGQARTLALALRLAEAMHLTKTKGEPIVLLDDILSELDSPRRSRVLAHLLQYEQTIITTTDLEQFTKSFLSGARLWRIDKNEAEEIINTKLETATG